MKLKDYIKENHDGSNVEFGASLEKPVRYDQVGIWIRRGCEFINGRVCCETARVKGVIND